MRNFDDYSAMRTSVGGDGDDAETAMTNAEANYEGAGNCAADAEDAAADASNLKTKHPVATA